MSLLSLLSVFDWTSITAWSINQSIKVLLTCWSLTSIVMAMQALLFR
jgi:hypothetical protein